MRQHARKRTAHQLQDQRPTLAVGHVVLKVADVGVTAAFYQRLGLRSIWLRDDLAILELRGGTHLLLFPTRRQRRSRRAAPFDLMAEDLDAAHAITLLNEFAATSIQHEPRSGHRYFTVEDPDGHRLTVYSSHTEGRLV